MKRSVSILAILLLILAFVPTAKAEPFRLDISNVIKFGTGIVSSVAIHEAGHWLLLEVTHRDYKFYFDGMRPTYQYEGKSRTSLQMSGLIANMVASEVILQIPKDRRGSFLNGILVGNILEEVLYPTLRWGTGDFKPLKKGDRIFFGACLVTHGLLTTYRVYHDGHLNAYTWFGASKIGTPLLGLALQW